MQAQLRALSHRNHCIEVAASLHLEIHTLATQNNDSLDFHNVSVWQLKRALEEAYQAGMKAAGDTSLIAKRSAEDMAAEVAVMASEPDNGDRFY